VAENFRWRFRLFFPVLRISDLTLRTGVFASPGWWWARAHRFKTRSV